MWSEEYHHYYYIDNQKSFNTIIIYTVSYCTIIMSCKDVYGYSLTVSECGRYKNKIMLHIYLTHAFNIDQIHTMII